MYKQLIVLTLTMTISISQCMCEITEGNNSAIIHAQAMENDFAKLNQLFDAPILSADTYHHGHAAYINGIAKCASCMILGPTNKDLSKARMTRGKLEIDINHIYHVNSAHGAPFMFRQTSHERALCKFCNRQGTILEVLTHICRNFRSLSPLEPISDQ